MAEVTKGSDATARDYGIEVADVRIQRAHLPEKRGSCASSSPSARNFLASCDASGNGASEYEALGGAVACATLWKAGRAFITVRGMKDNRA
jgi:hypothetical protein